jgi:cell division protein FtsB
MQALIDQLQAAYREKISYLEAQKAKLRGEIAKIKSGHEPVEDRQPLKTSHKLQLPPKPKPRVVPK